MFLTACSSGITRPQKDEISVDFDQINSGIKRSLRNKLDGELFKINESIYFDEARKYVDKNKDDKLFIETFDKEKGIIIFKGLKNHFFACAELPISELIICDYTEKDFAKMYSLKDVKLENALKEFTSGYK